MRNLINKIFFIADKFFFNPKLIFMAICNLPNYLKDYYKFKKKVNGNWPLNIYPILLEKEEQAANLGEYFFQDIFVAKKIIFSNPIRHVDVGSRIDGFIGHIACQRKVEVFDIRPLSNKIANIKFVQWDITRPNPKFYKISDCVSCLHTLEHIGLSRYGDKLDPNGWKKALYSLTTLLLPKGKLWISVPIGIQRVEFNAHRVFHPKTIIDEATINYLKLDSFYFLDRQKIKLSINLDKDIQRLSKKTYTLGIFSFVNNI
jgi:hypothetical protein